MAYPPPSAASSSAGRRSGYLLFMKCAIEIAEYLQLRRFSTTLEFKENFRRKCTKTNQTTSRIFFKRSPYLHKLIKARDGRFICICGVLHSLSSTQIISWSVLAVALQSGGSIPPPISSYHPIETQHPKAMTFPPPMRR